MMTRILLAATVLLQVATLQTLETATVLTLAPTPEMTMLSFNNPSVAPDLFRVLLLLGECIQQTDVLPLNSFQNYV